MGGEKYQRPGVSAEETTVGRALVVGLGVGVVDRELIWSVDLAVLLVPPFFGSGRGLRVGRFWGWFLLFWLRGIWIDEKSRGMSVLMEAVASRDFLNRFMFSAQIGS